MNHKNLERRYNHAFRNKTSSKNYPNSFCSERNTFDTDKTITNSFFNNINIPNVLLQQINQPNISIDQHISMIETPKLFYRPLIK